MQQLMRFILILGISLLGELLSSLIPLPIPGSVYGLALMMLVLCSRIIPLHAVEKPGRFLIDIMPVMFVPAAVGLIDSWTSLKPLLLPVVAIMFISTFVVMATAGRVTQAMIRRKDQKKESEAEK